MYFFDPSFGYIFITSGNDTVRYGRGPVVPHDPSSTTDQRYTRFEGWVEIESHHVPDEWLIAFANTEPKKEERIVVTTADLGWGWAEWFFFALASTFLGYLAIRL